MAVGRGGGSGIDNIEFQPARDLDWMAFGLVAACGLDCVG